MLRAFLRSRVKAFERRYDYDAGYMHEVLRISPKALFSLQGLGKMSGFRGPSPSIWAGALLASSLDGDCGPCAQLVVDLSLEAGVKADLLQAAARRDFARAGDVGLGFRFAEAAIEGAAELEDLRRAIVEGHGEEALVAASFASCSGRAYPVLKRGLGHAEACRRLVIGGEAIAPKAALRESAA